MRAVSEPPRWPDRGERRRDRADRLDVLRARRRRRRWRRGGRRGGRCRWRGHRGGGGRRRDRRRCVRDDHRSIGGFRRRGRRAGRWPGRFRLGTIGRAGPAAGGECGQREDRERSEHRQPGPGGRRTVSRPEKHPLATTLPEATSDLTAGDGMALGRRSDVQPGERQLEPDRQTVLHAAAQRRHLVGMGDERRPGQQRADRHGWRCRRPGGGTAARRRRGRRRA